jgi:hypothetical protein
MQVFLRAVSRALMKFGIAIAANRPMMATTIMISTSVKPALREVWIFILPLQRGVNLRQAGLFITAFLFTYCLTRPQSPLSNSRANVIGWFAEEFPRIGQSEMSFWKDMPHYETSILEGADKEGTY